MRFMKACLKMISSMAKANTSGKTGKSTLETGKMDFSMVMVK